MKAGLLDDETIFISSILLGLDEVFVGISVGFKHHLGPPKNFLPRVRFGSKRQAFNCDAHLTPQ
jgi:hypothetical protein